MPRPRTKLFSSSRSCETASAFGPGLHGLHGLGCGCCGERNVLELIGDDIDARGEARDLGGVVEVTNDGAGGNVERGARNVGIDAALEAQACGGKRQHAAELSAAKNADGGAGR